MDGVETIRVDAHAGWWIVNSKTGLVIESAQWERRECDLFPIVRFDLEEWREWCADSGFDPAGDIYWLALGFWLEDGKRELAEDDFRAELLVTYASELRTAHA
jgi:hypothetical protein